MDLRSKVKDKNKDKHGDQNEGEPPASKQTVNISHHEADMSGDKEESDGGVAILLREIREGNKILSEKIESKAAQLQTSIDEVKATMEGVLTRINEAEHCISSTEDSVDGLNRLMKELQKDNDFLKNKIDQLENHSRRNNVRVLGLKEVPALKAMKEKNITCYLIYPARLKILDKDGRVRFFDTARDALEFLNGPA